MTNSLICLFEDENKNCVKWCYPPRFAKNLTLCRGGGSLRWGVPLYLCCPLWQRSLSIMASLGKDQHLGFLALDPHLPAVCPLDKDVSHLLCSSPCNVYAAPCAQGRCVIDIDKDGEVQRPGTVPL